MANRLNKPRKGKPLKKSRAGQFLRERHGIGDSLPHRTRPEKVRRASEAQGKLLQRIFIVEDAIHAEGHKLTPKKRAKAMRNIRKARDTFNKGKKALKAFKKTKTLRLNIP